MTVKQIRHVLRGKLLDAGGQNGKDVENRRDTFLNDVCVTSPVNNAAEKSNVR